LGAAAAGAPPPPPPTNPLSLAFRTLREGARSPSFWALAGSFAVCGASTNGLIGTHFIPACIDAGMGEVAASSLYASMGALDIVGTIASGWMTERVSSVHLLVM
jgi:hypothetical protein